MSTGHFNTDAVNRNAAQEIVWTLCEGLLEPGDTVSIRGFQANVWSVNGAPQSVEVKPGKDSSVGDIWTMMPGTPDNRQNLGHDTERAVIDLCQLASPGRNSIVVLIAPEIKSQVGEGAGLAAPFVGEKDAAYVEAIRAFPIERVDPGQASLKLPFRFTEKGRSFDRTLDALLLVRGDFSGEPLASPRPAIQEAFERVKQADYPVQTPTKPGDPNPGPGPGPQMRTPPEPDNKAAIIATVIASLAVVAAIAWTLLRTRPIKKPRYLKVKDITFDLVNKQEADAVCTIVGQGYPGDSPNLVQIVGIPPLKVATFLYEGNEIRITAEQSRIIRKSLETVAGDISLEVGFVGEIVFEVEHRPQPLLPPTNVEVPIKVEILSS
ncbi:hypothetical protein OP10G_2666 [Fimbriimonas ginsengisoli Gsoil 348]|uniref:Uncharacterized protein n=1 Tax=Fimbriimonas ginsengisoli Gsoil 348 TaxID=661478 RepID=A0A068NWS2_FIMGI|nr:hypothetical protein OP10G_2666 [Fimbriimonas ginsengisoli Gsoil 348]